MYEITIQKIIIMIDYNSSGGSMRTFNNEQISKAIRMSLANVCMEEDFSLKEIDKNNLQNNSTCKVLVLQKGGTKNGSENIKRN